MDVLEEIKRKIWDGEYLGPTGALALHERLWGTLSREEQQEQVIPYAVTLYSARQVTDVRGRFQEIVDFLMRRIRRAYAEKDANALDTLSTHFLWWAKQDPRFFSHYRQVAFEVAQNGVEYTEHEPKGAHTGALLRTTLASMLPAGEPARWLLGQAAERALWIADANQKVRVYKRLAAGYAKQLRPFVALRCYLRALAVPGAGKDAKSKLGVGLKR